MTSTHSRTAVETATAMKRADYFAAGTRIVWDVDLESGDVFGLTIP